MAYATERAKMLFGCYRRVDANDPDTYVAALAVILSMYDTDLIREVTDPRTGVITSEKYMSFMPSVGEMKAYCDGIADRRERLQRLGAKPAPNFNRPALPRPEPRPGDLATIFVPEGNPRYQQLVDWAKAPDTDPRKWRFGVSSDNRKGIWVSYDTWENRQVKLRKATARQEVAERLTLSEEAKRVMGMVDAERNHALPMDEEVG